MVPFLPLLSCESSVSLKKTLVEKKITYNLKESVQFIPGKVFIENWKNNDASANILQVDFTLLGKLFL